MKLGGNRCPLCRTVLFISPRTSLIRMNQEEKNRKLLQPLNEEYSRLENTRKEEYKKFGNTLLKCIGSSRRLIIHGSSFAVKKSNIKPSGGHSNLASTSVGIGENPGIGVNAGICMNVGTRITRSMSRNAAILEALPDAGAAIPEEEVEIEEGRNVAIPEEEVEIEEGRNVAIPEEEGEIEEGQNAVLHAATAANEQPNTDDIVGNEADGLSSDFPQATGASPHGAGHSGASPNAATAANEQPNTDDIVGNKADGLSPDSPQATGASPHGAGHSGASPNAATAANEQPNTDAIVGERGRWTYFQLNHNNKYFDRLILHNFGKKYQPRKCCI